MVILRAWAEAPPSPGAQGRPLARATTQKTKKPGPCHREQSRGAGWSQANQLNTPLCSGHGTPAGCSPHPCWDSPLPA